MGGKGVKKRIYGVGMELANSKKTFPKTGKAFTNMVQSKQDLAANVLKLFIPAMPVIVAKARLVSYPPFSYGDIPFYFGG